MPTLTKEIYELVIQLLTGTILVYMLIIFVVKTQSTKINWAVFYATLYVLVILPFVNYWLIEFNFWHFTSTNNTIIRLPFNLYFIWVFFWSILPVWIFKGKHIVLIVLVLFWMDLIIMPILQNIGVLKLENNWIIGEIIVLLLVFVPAYTWAKFSFYGIRTDFRSIFQVMIMGCVFVLYIPFLLRSLKFIEPINLSWQPYLFQVFFIIILPSLIAVLDLVKKGKGTPFPFDKTTNLVRTGVYAYCRNPIQWSFTFMFIPMAIFFSSGLLLLGSLFSIAYVFGLAKIQEDDDLKLRFGQEWVDYKKSVPIWLFLWKPKSIPKGEVYFDSDCGVCSQIGRFFSNRNTINLDIKKAKSYEESSLNQVTYVDYLGESHQSVSAIAHVFQHINLGYAFLGWIMRLPGIKYLLQLLVDSIEINSSSDICKVK